MADWIKKYIDQLSRLYWFALNSASLYVYCVTGCPLLSMNPLSNDVR